MSETHTYPALDEGNIKIVLKHLSDNPQYLNDANCPYTEDTKSLFLKPTSTDTGKIVNNIQRQIDVLDKLNAPRPECSSLLCSSHGSHGR